MLFNMTFTVGFCHQKRGPYLRAEFFNWLVWFPDWGTAPKTEYEFPYLSDNEPYLNNITQLHTEILNLGKKRGHSHQISILH